MENLLEREKLMQRLNLANRPSLSYDYSELASVSAMLVSSGLERERFLNDPQAYLGALRVPVSECNLVGGSPATVEACTNTIICYSRVYTSLSTVNSIVNLNYMTTVNITLTQTYTNNEITLQTGGYVVKLQDRPQAGFGYVDVV